MGSRPFRDAVAAQWSIPAPAGTLFTMTQHSPLPAAAEAATGTILTAAGYDELVREMELLRSTHRTELAQRLRDARTFGSPGDDDEWLAALEDTAVDRVRIAQLERLLATATVVDEAPSSDGAALGSLVWVQDDAGRAAQYQLVGRRSARDDGTEVSLASPVGKALRGAQPGDVVDVELPNGRTRSLTVLDVRSGNQDAREPSALAA
jgi:transcription elongation factor GreA